MLLSFRVENHKSVRDEQQLLLTPTYGDARPENADWQASTVAGIFGANASGKSNVLDALTYMRRAVRWSMNDNEPGGGIARAPFALSPEAGEEPSTYVVDLMLDGVRHTYGFSVDDTEVVEEWLYAYPKRRRRVVFERDEDGFSFGEESRSALPQVRQLTGRNVLFLTVAARTASVEVAPVYRWFSEALVFAEERGMEVPRWLRRRVPGEHVERLSALLRSADTGVHSVELQEEQGLQLPGRLLRLNLDEQQEWIRAFLDSSDAGVHSVERQEDVRGDEQHEQDPEVVSPSGEAPGAERSRISRQSIRRAFRQGLPELDSEIMRESMYLTFKQTGMPPLAFRHSADHDVPPLTWSDESRGTKALTSLGYQAHRVLETGGVLVVDEIDASLHPYLSARIISLFRDEEENPHGAQLLFTSHDAALLGRIRGEEVLKRDHIWFVDKDERGRTELYPLSDFKPRGDDNRSRRYLTGRYGAVPDVDDALFREALSRRESEAAPQ